MTVPEKAPFEVPTIDIAAFLADPESAEASQIIAKVRQACMTTGFMQIVGHGIPRALQDQVFKASKAFFSLPFEEKVKLDLRTAVGKSNRGYELIGSQALEEKTLPDLKEGFYVGMDVPEDDERVKRGVFLVGPNRWPSEDLIPNSILREPVEEYYKHMRALCLVVMDILARGLPYGPHIFDEFNKDAVAAIRMLHYPPQTSKDPKQLGAGAHTDFGAITLLLQDEHPGLQVLNESTKEWIPVPPNPDAYVVNIGDMLEMWTKGVYRSNVHRVLNYGMTDRYSLPFFFDGNPACKLTPFEGVVEPGTKIKTAEDHMKECFTTTYGRGTLDKEIATAA